VGNSTYWVGNPAVVYSHLSSRVVLLFVNHASGCVGGCGTGNGMVTSSDDGVSWSEPTDLSKQFGPASGSLPGPGVASELFKGRLAVPCHHGAYQEDYVVVSDNGGDIWFPINQTFKGMDEATMTKTGDGNVILNMRHRDATSKGRAVAVSHDNGITFGDIYYDKSLRSPVCQASIASIGNVTYFSNPDSSSARQSISVKCSNDFTHTWPGDQVVYPGSSYGYSCLVAGALASGSGGLLYEADKSSIKFSSFSLQCPP